MEKQILMELSNAGILPKAANMTDWEYLMQHAERLGLSIPAHEIMLKKAGSKLFIVCSLQGLRRCCEATGRIRENKESLYNVTSDGNFQTVGELTSSPVSCTHVIVTDSGQYSHNVRFDEFYCSTSHWLKMPAQMISNIAEAFALRKAFPDLLSGVTVSAEWAIIESTQSDPIRGIDTMDKLAQYWHNSDQSEYIKRLCAEQKKKILFLNR